MSGADRLARVLLAAALALSAALPVAASAQERQPIPLSHLDIERLLSGDTYSRDEIVRIIERSCLSFEVSPQDLRELRALGADDAIISAIEACRAPPAPAPVVASLSAARLTSQAGEMARLSVRVTRGGAPLPGARLVLQGSELVPGGAGRPLVSTTDSQGRALFQIPAGTAAAEHRLRVTRTGGSLGGRTSVTLAVSPGSLDRVAVEPSRLRLIGETPVSLQVVAQDRWRNPVPGAELTLVARSLAPETGGDPPFPPMTRVADAAGRVAFPVEPLPELRRFTLEVQGEGRALASVPVSVALALLERTRDETSPTPEPRRGEEDEPAREGARPADAAAPVDSVAPPARERTPADSARADRAGAADEPPVAPRGAPSDPDRAALIAERHRLAARALERGAAARAAGLYEGLVFLAPDDPEAWLGLGRARAARGDAAGARAALERARELEPELAGQVAAELEAIGPIPPWIEIDVWGGTAIETASTTGQVMVEATVRPLPFLRVWGRYDDALGIHAPIFVRRAPDLRSYWGGAAVDWGAGRRLTTSVEVGRRDLSDGLYEYVYHGEQAVGWGAGDRFAVGGYFGRWHDRDDWAGYGRLDVAVAPGVGVSPALWVGETVTSVDDSTRLVEREVRAYAGLVLRPLRPIELSPSLGVGSVDGDDPALDGTLIDGRMRVVVHLGAASRLQLFARHQRPPGGEAFTAVAAGLGLSIGPTPP